MIRDRSVTDMGNWWKKAIDEFFWSNQGKGVARLVAVFPVGDDWLTKGAEHKYKLRVNAKNPPPKYKYFYDLPGKGVVRDDNLMIGAKFQGHDPSTGEAGHFEVVGISNDKSQVYVRHDESKTMKWMTQGELRDLLHGKGQAIGEEARRKGKAALERYKAALKHGTDFHKDKQREAVLAHVKAYGDEAMAKEFEKVDHKKPKDEGPLKGISFTAATGEKHDFGEGVLEISNANEFIVYSPFKVKKFPGLDVPIFVMNDEMKEALEKAPLVAPSPGNIFLPSQSSGVIPRSSFEDIGKPGSGAPRYVKIGGVTLLVSDAPGHAVAALAWAKGIYPAGKMLNLDAPENRKFLTSEAEKYFFPEAKKDKITPKIWEHLKKEAKEKEAKEAGSKKGKAKEKSPAKQKEPKIGKGNLTLGDVNDRIKKLGETIVTPAMVGMSEEKKGQAYKFDREELTGIAPVQYESRTVSVYRFEGAHLDDPKAFDHDFNEPDSYKGIPTVALRDALEALRAELNDASNSEYTFPHVPKEARTRAEVAVMIATTLFTAGHVPSVRLPETFDPSKAWNEIVGGGQFSFTPNSGHYEFAHEVMTKLATQKLDNPAQVFRGVRFDDDIVGLIEDAIKKGDKPVMDLRSVSSWSTSQMGAKKFVGNVMFKMKTKYGNTLHQVSGYPTENEIVVGGGVRMVSFYRDPNEYWYTVECENIPMEEYNKEEAVVKGIKEKSEKTGGKSNKDGKKNKAGFPPSKVSTLPLDVQAAIDEQFNLSAFDGQRKSGDSKAAKDLKEEDKGGKAEKGLDSGHIEITVGGGFGAPEVVILKKRS